MIGDVLTSSILCEALKERFSHSEVHYLINSHTLPVVQENPFIDSFILFTPEMEKSTKLQSQLRNKIKQEGYAAVIDVYSKLGSARIAHGSKAPLIIGYKKWYTRLAYTHLFTYHWEPTTIAGTAVENRMKLLAPIMENYPKERKPKIYLRESEAAFAKAQLKEHHIKRDKPLFMISVLGSSREKTYPLPYLALLLDTIVAHTQAQLLLNYIPNQLGEVNKLLMLCSSQTRAHICKDLYGNSLREFIALTAECDALIGNEGGAVNIAKALEVPTFAIFSPWIYKKAWALYQNNQNVAVHLEDYHPEIYEKTTLKRMRKRQKEYYNLFTPKMIEPALVTFLDTLKD